MSKLMDTKSFKTKDEATNWVLTKAFGHIKVLGGETIYDLGQKSRPLVVMLYNGNDQISISFKTCDFDSGTCRS